MHFDDRLATVLRLPASGEAIARNQFRQLLDLLGIAPADARGPQVDAAYQRLAELARTIPPGDRARIAADPVLRLRSPRLIAALAEAEPDVARAAVRAARLSEDQWLDLVPALSVVSRGVLRDHGGMGPRAEALLARLGIADRGLPPAAAAGDAADDADRAEMGAETLAAPEPSVPLEPAQPQSQPQSQSQPAAPPLAPALVAHEVAGIGDIVRRIEAFRKQRSDDAAAAPHDTPRLPLGDAQPAAAAPRLTAIDFATDAEGRLTWASAPAAPMVLGLRIGSLDPASPARASAALATAVRHRQPLRAQRLAIAGAPAVCGDWQVDAVPGFDLPGGRFTGYCGRLRKLPEDAAAAARLSPAASEADRMRQILHELRTPVNAVQGFAEVIQQQLFGPAPHEYRALAASVASDAARVLAGLEELDRLVKLDARVLELDPGASDLAAVVTATIGQIAAHTASRQSGFAAELEPGPMPIALAPAETERVVWRLLATLAGEAAPGEQLRLRLRPRDGRVRLTVRLPGALAARDDSDLFHATMPLQPRTLAAGMFGTGFALRLVAAEVRAAGGRFTRKGEKLLVELPRLMEDTAAAPAA